MVPCHRAPDAKTVKKKKIAAKLKLTTKSKSFKLDGKKLIVKKGTARGTYKLNVKASYSAKGNYAKASKSFTVKVTVR